VRTWSDVVDYRARNKAHADYPIEAPCRTMDLSQPPALAARAAAAWLRSLETVLSTHGAI
jgi:hypothetical protein